MIDRDRVSGFFLGNFKVVALHIFHIVMVHIDFWSVWNCSVHRTHRVLALVVGVFRNTGERCWWACINFQLYFCCFWTPLPVFCWLGRVVWFCWGWELSPFFWVLFSCFNWRHLRWVLSFVVSWVLYLWRDWFYLLRVKFFWVWWNWSDCFVLIVLIILHFVWFSYLICDWFLWRRWELVVRCEYYKAIL